MEAQGIIRKISIGDLKEGLTYVVGQKMKVGEVVQVLHDTMYLVEYGINKYDVYVRADENIRLWKSFMNGQISVEYDIAVRYEVV